MDRYLDLLLGSRATGAVARAATLVRVAAGAFFVFAGAGKFADHAKELADFERWGVPAADVAVYAAGALEVIGGLLLVLGLATRAIAAALAGEMVGAISTAGRVEGGAFHLGVAPTMLAAMLFLTWAGAAAPALDAKLRASRLRLPAGR